MTRDEKIKLLHDKGCRGMPCHSCRLRIICEPYDSFADWPDEALDDGLRIIGLDPETRPDVVNHPQHYELPGGLECIDAMVATLGRDTVMAFCKANAFKYLWRHERKNGDEDVEKARWYLNKWHELKEEAENEAASHAS